MDISTTAAMYDSTLGDFTIVNYANTPAGVNFMALNNGHSFKVSFDGNMYNVYMWRRKRLGTVNFSKNVWDWKGTGKKMTNFGTLSVPMLCPYRF